MNGQSQDTVELLKKKLSELVPEAFTEGKIDWEKLKAALGQEINFSNERYVLNWAGKSDAFRVMQVPSSKTLVPAKDESVNFDETENIFIEGENLEALKVLQKSYFGKVKMIYIDPPYNTGNDSFIYPDKFSETRKEYQKRVGDKDDEGYMTKDGMFHKNSKENGQYHSNWLNMMYPRLFMARNLLRDDGLIFVSIDDNEVHNLRLLMNEIFGEENFVAALVYDKNRKNDAKYFSVGHEYMLVYFKNYQAIKDLGLIFRTEKEGVDEIKDEFKRLAKLHNNEWSKVQLGLKEYYKNWDKDDDRAPLKRFTKVDEKGPYRDDGNISWPGGSGPKYEVLHPVTLKPCKVPDGGWRFPDPKKMEAEIKRGRVVFGSDETTLPRIRRNLFEADNEVLRSVHFSYAQTATVEFNKIFDNVRVFENPKNPDDLSQLIDYVTEPNGLDIVLDFFSGSGTLAHAIFDLNKKDGGNRRFVCVQLPEKCDPKSEAYKAGYETIADISKERMRRVIKKIREKKKEEKKKGKQLSLENPEHTNKDNQDLGFKVFKLAKSNLKQWRPKPKDEKELVEQMKMFVNPVDGEPTDESMAFELLLKSGLDLNSNIEAKEGFHLVNDGELALVLSATSEDTFKTLVELTPTKVIALDSVFKDNDQLKTNMALQLKEAGIDFRTI